MVSLKIPETAGDWCSALKSHRATDSRKQLCVKLHVHESSYLPPSCFKCQLLFITCILIISPTSFNPRCFIWRSFRVPCQDVTLIIFLPLVMCTFRNKNGKANNLSTRKAERDNVECCFCRLYKRMFLRWHRRVGGGIQKLEQNFSVSGAKNMYLNHKEICCAACVKTQTFNLHPGH